MTHWTDEALSADADDQLDRRQFAGRVAELINHVTIDHGSTVFGLISPWGSGKTTLINFIVNRIDEPWRIVHFTPWAASSIEALLSEFFAVIASALPSEGEARAKLVAYARYAVLALGAIPVIGQTAKDAGNTVLDRLDQQKPWSEQFEDVSNQLKELETPVLVVADDIDRLEADELAALLKAIRLLGRFPGVHYLLAYDQDTLVDVLQGTGVAGNNRERALAYLEKIVQYPLAVPPARQVHLNRMLNAGLKDVLSDTDHRMESEAARRFELAYEDLLAQTMTTVRSIQRFLAQARAYLPLLEPSEIDVVDLLLLTHLRMHFPTVYAKLTNWRAELIGESSSDGQPNWTDRLRSAGVAEHLVIPVETILQEMFPDMRGRTVGFGSSGNRRVHESDYFSRYFTLGVSDDDIADATVEQALAEAATEIDGTALASFLSAVRGTDDSVGRLAIRKAVRLSDNLDHSKILPLTKYVAALVSTLPDRRADLGNIHNSVITWFAHLLLRLQRMPAPRQIEDLVESAGVHNFTRALRLALNNPASAAKDGPVPEIAAQFAKQAHARIIDNFAALDQAGDDPVIFLSEIVTIAGARQKLTDEITAGLSSGRWKIDDVAARFVSVGWIIGTPERELMDFDSRGLLTILPTAQSYLKALPSDEANDAANERDLSWANRRRAARRALRSLAARATKSSRRER